MSELVSLGSPLFWMIVSAVAVLFVWLGWKVRRKRRYDLSKITLKDIDKMDGHEFEDYLFVLLSALQYERVYQTKKSRDYGADLIFEDELEVRTVVQAKRYRDKLGLSAVQEIFTAKAYYQANRAIIITTASRISEPCLKLASATEVQIIDREDLEDLIKLFKKGRIDEASTILEEPLEAISYKPSDSLERPIEKRGMIQAGDYFYRL